MHFCKNSMNFLSYKGLKQQNICTTFVFRPKIYGLFLHLFRFLFCIVLTYSYLCPPIIGMMPV